MTCRDCVGTDRSSDRQTLRYTFWTFSKLHCDSEEELSRGFPLWKCFRLPWDFPFNETSGLTVVPQPDRETHFSDLSASDGGRWTFSWRRQQNRYARMTFILCKTQCKNIMFSKGWHKVQEGHYTLLTHCQSRGTSALLETTVKTYETCVDGDINIVTHGLLITTCL